MVLFCFFFNHILSLRFVHVHVQTERVCASISRLCFPPNLYGTVHFLGPENRKMHIALKDRCVGVSDIWLSDWRLQPATNLQ